MELAFSTKTLRNLCESESKAKATLGEDIAIKLMGRVADFQAATCASDLIVGNPKELTGVGDQHYSVSLNDKTAIVFCANHVFNPKKDGKIDWSRVTRIKILEIGGNRD